MEDNELMEQFTTELANVWASKTLQEFYDRWFGNSGVLLKEMQELSDQHDRAFIKQLYEMQSSGPAATFRERRSILMNRCHEFTAAFDQHMKYVEKMESYMERAGLDTFLSELPLNIVPGNAEAE